MDKPTVQDIFLRFYPRYLEQYRPSPQQAKTANNIINCKTGAYGANVSVCEDCGSIQIYYNSCRNRCCPMCQALLYNALYHAASDTLDGVSADGKNGEEAVYDQ